MSTENIMAAVILAIAVLGIVGMKVYKMRKSGQSISLDSLISTYSDQIINALQDVVVILQTNADDFEDRDSYEKAIISMTIDKLKENSAEFGLDGAILRVIDTETLTAIIHKIFDGNMEKIFSIFNADQIQNRPELYDDTVVAALTKAEENTTEEKE